MSASAYTRAVFFEDVYSSAFDAEFPKEWMEVPSAIQALSYRYHSVFGAIGFTVPNDSHEKLETLELILDSPAFEREGDEYTGHWMRVNFKAKDEVVHAWLNQSPEAQRLKTLGPEARVRALTKAAAELGWTLERPAELSVSAPALNEPSNPLEIPASDRIVTIADNQEVIAEIQDCLEEIGNHLKENNEVGGEVGDGREILNLEIETAKIVTRQGSFRISSLLGWLNPALRYLTDKFAGAAIGEAAKKLLQLLIGLL